MQWNTSWRLWGALLGFVIFLVRVVLKLRNTRNAARDIANGDLSLLTGIDGSQLGSAGASVNGSPAWSITQSAGGFGRRTVYKLDMKTASVSDIPKALLDSLSPAQQKLLLDKLNEAKGASTDGALPPKVQQAS